MNAPSYDLSTQESSDQLNFEEQSMVVGNYLVMAGALNEEGKPYGINEKGKVDILGVNREVAVEIGKQATGAMAINVLMGLPLPYEAPEGANPLAYNSQAIATEWGAERALQKLSEPDGSTGTLDGRTIQEKVDTFLAQHAGAKEYNLEGTRNMLNQLHDIISMDPKGSAEIVYSVSANTMLHLQETRRGQCVVSSTLGAVILRRLGLDTRYITATKHQYLGVVVDGDKTAYYDGIIGSNPVEKDSPIDKLAGKTMPINPGYHDNYAISLDVTRPLRDRECEYIEALRIDPDNTDTRRRYADAIALRGDFQEALRQYGICGYSTDFFSRRSLIKDFFEKINNFNKKIALHNQKLPKESLERIDLLEFPQHPPVLQGKIGNFLKKALSAIR